MAVNESFKSAQVWVDDKILLKKISKKKGISEVALMHLAIDWLRRKYRLKDIDLNGNTNERTN